MLSDLALQTVRLSRDVRTTNKDKVFLEETYAVWFSRESNLTYILVPSSHLQVLNKVKKSYFSSQQTRTLKTVLKWLFVMLLVRSRSSKFKQTWPMDEMPVTIVNSTWWVSLLFVDEKQALFELSHLARYSQKYLWVQFTLSLISFSVSMVIIFPEPSKSWLQQALWADGQSSVCFLVVLAFHQQLKNCNVFNSFWQLFFSNIITWWNEFFFIDLHEKK